MSEPILVQIIGAPIACKEGMKDTWREVAEWARGQLQQRFGESVKVKYYELFDPACPSIPPKAQLPIVLVNSEVLMCGVKISVPKIQGKIETILKMQIV